MATHFELLDLEPHEQRLIALISPTATRFFLSPLDKGLSGARTLIVRWSIDERLHSAQRVVKIGEARKIEREYEAVQGILPLMPRLGAMRLLPDLSEPASHRLLLQEYGGGSAVPVSLRQRLGKFSPGVTPSPSPSVSAATKMVERVFQIALKDVHFQRPESYTAKEENFGAVLDWWLAKGGLKGASIEKDLSASAPRLAARGLPRPQQILDLIDELLTRKSTFSYGYVHGDLHTQNVLIDENDAPFLVDFAWSGRKWRAVDFLMMECSLKFVCTPSDADIDDLCELETLLDTEASETDLTAWAEDRPFGREIAPVAAGVLAVRRLALGCGAAADLAQYRHGLALFTSSLATRPGLNRLYLLHSLAHQTRRILE